MQKRGQISLFLILGVVIVIVVFLFLFLKTEKSEISVNVKGDITPIKNYISSCLDKSAEISVWEIGLIGGYKNPNEWVVYDDRNVPVYEEIPTISDIEKSLSEDILSEFEDCFDMDVIKRLGFDVELTGLKKVDVSVYDESVFVKLQYPLKLKSLDYSAEISDFSTTIDVNLGELYKNSVDLVNKARINSPYDITPDCSLYDTNGLTNVYVINVGEEKIVKFIDYSGFYSRYLRSYVFQFALKDIDINGECVG